MTIGQRFWTPVLYNYKASSSDGPIFWPTPRLLACSVNNSNQQRLFALRDLDRKLCEDRKTPLEHLAPKTLLKSTFRIVVTQSSLILSNYANDQLHGDLARDKLVAQGKMTQDEADEAAEEWETREWQVRWETFPGKLTEALVKYHVIMLVIRLYEHIASKFVDAFTLDALTLDTFRYAKRLGAKEDDRTKVGREMFQVCGQANLIAFLADYSVHQLILGYGYYRYIRERRRKRQERQDNDNDDDDDDDNNETHPILKQSATLVMSRSLGLAFTAVGGAAGSALMPGWGTLLGSNLGDSLGGIVSEGSASLSG